ncbi:MAG: DUF3822 family protein [Bacteroidaceae bacterium]|nr:DUF3822 family protein [Bacteroidaceae bacterium]
MAENQINNKSLSIRVCSNGLSFCTYAPGQEKPFEYKAWDVNHTISLAANLKDALMNEPMLGQEYQRVNVLITTPHFTTVPVAAFQKEDIGAVYQFVFPKDKAQHISYNVLRRSGIAIVFGLDRNIHQLLLDDFPRARFYASASTLIEFFGENSLFGKGRKMYVYLHEKEMTVYAFEQGRMLFVNTFPVMSVADMQYYVLNVWKEQAFDQVDDSLLIVGDKESLCVELSEKIKYFLQQVSVFDRSEDFKDKLTQGNTLIPYDLQTLLICGF